VADKLLKEMEQSGQVMGKATKKDGGGQWVFWPVQVRSQPIPSYLAISAKFPKDASDSASPEELFIMDEQITRLRESLPALKTSFRLVTAKLNAILAAPSASELAAMVQNLQEDIKTKREKLYGFKNGSAKIVTKEESETIEREFKYWSARRKGRKDAFANLEANLLEGLTTEEIMDKAGLEHDPYQFKG
jgi:26S proteasome regulatory subunit (ATPase 3-interacting protein)